MFRDDFIHDAVRLGLLRSHDEITLHILFNLFDRLSRSDVRMTLDNRAYRSSVLFSSHSR